MSKVDFLAAVPPSSGKLRPIPDLLDLDSKLKFTEKALDKFEPLKFHMRLWDADFESVLYAKMKDGKESAKTISNFAQRLSTLEAQYAKDLKKLVESTAPVIEEKNLMHCWQSLLDGVNKCADHHWSFSRSVFEGMHLPLANVKDYVKDQRDQFELMYNDAQKQLAEANAAFDKIHLKKSKDEDRARARAGAGALRYVEEEKAAAEVVKIKEQKFYNTIVHILKRMEALEIERMCDVTNSIKQFAHLFIHFERSRLYEAGEIASRISELLVRENIETWVTTHASGKPCPWFAAEAPEEKEEHVEIVSEVVDKVEEDLEVYNDSNIFLTPDLDVYDEWDSGKAPPSWAQRQSAVLDDIIRRKLQGGFDDPSLIEQLLDLVKSLLNVPDEDFLRLNHAIEDSLKGSTGEGILRIRLKIAKSVLRTPEKQFKDSLTLWEKETAVRQIELVLAHIWDFRQDELDKYGSSDTTDAMVKVFREALAHLQAGRPSNILKIFAVLEGHAKELDKHFKGDYSKNFCRKLYEALGKLTVKEGWSNYTDCVAILDFGVVERVRTCSETRLGLELLGFAEDSETVHAVCGLIVENIKKISLEENRTSYEIAVTKALETTLERALSFKEELSVEAASSYVLVLVSVHRLFTISSDQWSSEIRDIYLSDLVKRICTRRYQFCKRGGRRFSAFGHFDQENWLRFSDAFMTGFFRNVELFVPVFALLDSEVKSEMVVIESFLTNLGSDMSKVLEDEVHGDLVYVVAGSLKVIISNVFRSAVKAGGGDGKALALLGRLNENIHLVAGREISQWIDTMSSSLRVKAISLADSELFKPNGSDIISESMAALEKQLHGDIEKFFILLTKTFPYGLFYLNPSDKAVHSIITKFSQSIAEIIGLFCEKLYALAKDRKTIELQIEEKAEKGDEKSALSSTLGKKDTRSRYISKFITKTISSIMTDKVIIPELHVPKLISKSLLVFVCNVQRCLEILQKMENLCKERWEELWSGSEDLPDILAIPAFAKDLYEIKVLKMVVLAEKQTTLTQYVYDGLTLLAEKHVRHDLIGCFHKKLYLPNAMTRIVGGVFSRELDIAFCKVVKTVSEEHIALLSKAFLEVIVRDLVKVLSDERYLRAFDEEDTVTCVDDCKWLKDYYSKFLPPETLDSVMEPLNSLLADMGRSTHVLIQLYKQNKITRHRAARVLGNRRNDIHAQQWIKETSAT